MEQHPDFMDAKKVGEVYLHQFWESLGKAMVTGQLKRVKSEKAVTGPNGESVIEREYEPIKGDSTVFVWMTKNILKWRDRSDIELSGKDGSPVRITLSPEERKARIEQLIKKAKT